MENTSKPNIRSSNLELLRIIAMLLIIAHHFVVNSAVHYEFDVAGGADINTVFLQLFGMWGKTAINAFVMITGYFMCTSKQTVSRVMRVYLEIKFYRIAIFFILLALGFDHIFLENLIDVAFGVAVNMNSDFESSFIAFSLLIPFYNMLIHAMDKRRHLILIAVLLGVYTVSSTFFFNSHVFSYIGWYITLYFVAAYIKLYPPKWTENNKICASALLGLIALSLLSVLGMDYIIHKKFSFFDPYFFVNDSNKILAFLVGVFAFLTFKNLKIKNSKIINTIASTTFGVLLIHASSDAMRELLWDKIVDVKGHFTLPLPKLALFSVVTVIAVFAVCSVIDLVRINLIEKPLFRKLGKFKWFNKTIF